MLLLLNCPLDGPEHNTVGEYVLDFRNYSLMFRECSFHERNFVGMHVLRLSQGVEKAPIRLHV